MDLLGTLTRFLVGRRVDTSRHVVTDVLDRASDFKTLSDEQLKSAYAQLLEVREGARPKPTPHQRVVFVLQWLAALFGVRQPQFDMIDALALAYEGFARAPADLRETVPPGTPIGLYPEQIQLASELSLGAFVQMATGEGKTYGILPAALYLLTGYPTVYIVCASDYLAWRDAHRTQAFWEFFGISVGLGQRGQNDADWSAQVVYTTLRALVFRSMEMEIARIRHPHPLIMGAVILDEADAIVLDSAFQAYALVRSIAAESFDWEHAGAVASQLEEDEDIDVDYASLTGRLTVEGERKVRGAFGGGAFDAMGDYLVFRRAVEIAFIAFRIVVEGEDYVVEDDVVLPIDRLTGKIDRGATPAWRYCLAHKLGSSHGYESVTIHTVVPFAVLDRFPHVCGTSGTVVDNALEYLLVHRRLVSEVLPRYKRNEERLEDLVFVTSEEAQDAVIIEVKRYLAEGRPVLVGTQNINDGEAIYRRVVSDPEVTCDVRLITGKNDQETVRFFEDAGQRTVLTVATQLAGRGVDIRLSPEVRAQGGMALICLGRGFEARHDRQFCGRVGRQGDPCTVQFILSLDDRLMQLFGGTHMQSTLNSLGIEPGEPVQHPWVNRALDTAQKKVGRREFFRRLHRRYIEEINLPQVEALARWFAMLRIGGRKLTDRCSDEFIEHAVATFLNDHLEEHLSGKKPIDRDEARLIFDLLGHQLGTLPDDLSPLAFESRKPTVLKEQLQDRLVAAIQEAQSRWQRRLLHLHVEHLAMLEQQREREALAATEATGSEGAALLPLERRDHVESLDIEAAGDDFGFLDETESDTPKDPDEDRRDDAAAIVAVETGDMPGVETSVEPMASLLLGSALLGKLMEHTPRVIAAETILGSWRHFIHHRDSIVFRIQQVHDLNFSVGTQIRRQIAAAYDRTSLELSRSVVANLMHADQGDEMDELFFLLDSNRPMPVEVGQQGGYDWTAPNTAARNRSLIAAKNRPSEAHEHIQRFLARHSARFQDPFELDEGQVAFVLASFLREHPIETLRSPPTILRAVEAWYENQVETQGVSLERARKNRSWLWSFLQSLRDSRLIGPLPGPKDRAISWARRLMTNMGDTSVLLLSGGAALFVLILVLSAQVQIGSTPWHWQNQELRFLDAVLFAGTAEQKGLLAAVIFLLAGFLYLPKIMPHLPGLLRFAAPFLLLSAGPFPFPVLATDWNGWVWPILNVLGFGALVWLGAHLLKVLSEWMQLSAQFQPFDFWLAFTTTAVAAPQFLYRAPHGIVLVVAAVAVGALFIAWRYLNASAVTIRSQRIISAATMRAEEVEATRVVRLDSTAPPLFLALVTGWLSYDLTGTSGLAESALIRQAIGIATFVAVLAIIQAALIIRASDLLRWQRLLSDNRQQLADVASDAELKAFLSRLRWRLLSREFTAALALAAGVVALHATLLPASAFTLPTGVMLMFLGMLGATALDRCLHAVVRLLLGNSAALGAAVLNVGQHEATDSGQNMLARIGKKSVEGVFKIISVLAAILFVIRYVAEIPAVIEVWQAIRQLI